MPDASFVTIAFAFDALLLDSTNRSARKYLEKQLGAVFGPDDAQELITAGLEFRRKQLAKRQEVR